MNPRIFEEAKKEANNPEKYLWMSFADPAKPKGQQNLGVIIIKTKGLATAIIKTHEMGINPGGAIQSEFLSDEFVKENILPDPSCLNKLLKKEDLMMYDLISAEEH